MTISMTTHFDQDINFSEEERIAALQRYHILDTPVEGSYDRLTKLIANLLKMPVATISLVDKNRVWYKSAYGVDFNQTSRDAGFCELAMNAESFFMVEDALHHPDAIHKSLVSGDFGMRFYAGVPLLTKDGFPLGTFSVMDKQPRTLNSKEIEIFKDMRDIVMDQIEQRLASRRSIAQQNQLLNTTAHDLKNPLTTIPVRADLIKMKKDNPDMVDNLCDQIKIASLNMVRIIDELLHAGTIDAGKVHLLLIKLNVSFLVGNVVSMNQLLADRKDQRIHFESQGDLYVNADEGKLAEIVDNLINNAIKYSPQGGAIHVSVKRDGTKAVISVADHGLGLTRDDLEKLYQPFTRLSAIPTGGEHSTGLGLSIVKVLVEAHQGRIRAQSEGKNKGAKFTVELPLRNG